MQSENPTRRPSCRAVDRPKNLSGTRKKRSQFVRKRLIRLDNGFASMTTMHQPVTMHIASPMPSVRSPSRLRVARVKWIGICATCQNVDVSHSQREGSLRSTRVNRRLGFSSHIRHWDAHKSSISNDSAESHSKDRRLGERGNEVNKQTPDTKMASSRGGDPVDIPSGETQACWLWWQRCHRGPDPRLQ